MPLFAEVISPTAAQPSATDLSVSTARFFDEARAASLVEHAGIVQVFDCDFHPRTGRAYMVLEYLEGMSLRQRLDANRGPAAQPWAVGIAGRAGR